MRGGERPSWNGKVNYLRRKRPARKIKKAFSKQLSGPRGGLAAMERGGKRPAERAKLLRGCHRACPLCLPTKKRISRREIRFRRTAAIVPPRSSPAFYRILRRLEIASARAAAPKIAASVAGSGTCVIETERAFSPNRSSYENPSGPITETEASFAPKSEDS